MDENRLIDDINRAKTTWHITFGTYGTRLHGGERLSVDHHENTPGEKFVERNDRREHFEKNLMKGDAVYLSESQLRFIEETIPALCTRGGWTLRTCAAGVERDHVHVLLDIKPDIHGKQVRRWLKLWLGEALSEKFGNPTARWWSQGGSTKVVDNETYLNNAYPYIADQRASK